LTKPKNIHGDNLVLKEKLLALKEKTSLIKIPLHWLLSVMIITPFAAVLTVYSAGVFDKILPSAVDVACKFQEWQSGHSIKDKKPEDPRFTILVSRLDRDTDGSQTEHLISAFERNASVEIVPICEALHGEVQSGVAWSFTRKQTEEEGRRLLQQHHADLLVAGRVAKTNQALELRFIGSADHRTAGPLAYKLDDTMNLPTNFHEEVAVQVVALALAGVRPVTERAGNFLAATLIPVATKIKAFINSSNPALTAKQRADLSHAFGLAAATIGDQAGDLDWLRQAIDAYLAALKERTRDQHPLDWAATQNYLGNALLGLSERTGEPSTLEQAVDAYKAALEKRTRDYFPLEWATSMNNLGSALLTLGERETGTVRLYQALEAYTAALEERKRELAPANWAQTQNNLGIVFLRLGERERRLRWFNQALKAHRSALEEYHRGSFPLAWAQTQNNLGVALTKLGELEAVTTTRLHQAIEAFSAALEEQTREHVPLSWAAIQNNLGLALLRLGERKVETAQLERAVDTFEAALEERTREKVPFAWAVSQNNLGDAYFSLGKSGSITARMMQAVDAYTQSLEEFKRANAPYYVSIVENSLIRTKAEIEAINLSLP
jgi:tetratricopeptide (TPR) repeat protein